MITVARIVNGIAINLDSKSGFYKCSVCGFTNWHINSVIHHIENQKYTRLTKALKHYMSMKDRMYYQRKNRHFKHK